MADLVMKEQGLFLITGENGDLTGATGPQGLYFHDTRYLSRLELRIGGAAPTVLYASAAENNQMRLVCRSNRTADGELKSHEVMTVERRRTIWDGVLYEQIACTNHSIRPIQVALSVRFAADFRDLFEARGTVRKARGEYLPPAAGDGRLTLGYRGLDDVTRRLAVTCTPAPASLGMGSEEPNSAEAAWTLTLAPGETGAVELAFATDGRAVLTYAEALGAVQAAYAGWRRACTAIATDHPQFGRLLERSYLDIRALLSDDGHGPYTVAGIPIYAVLYGRDSLITALELLPINPGIAKGTLRTLAAVQGRELNAWRQEEPGKIIHELRPGELGRLEEIPFGRYYGSVDATPLFLVLVAEYYAWTGDLALVRELLPNVRAALGWLETYGDSDGDGFLEYRADEQGIGLHVQSWKDSHYSMCHRSGERAVSPVAVSEVQGYAYQARRGLAPILAALGETELAARLTAEADDLKRKFNDAFWMADRQFPAIALDGVKRQVGTVSSDIGHCLWSGIIAEGEKAAAVADRLVAPDLFSGWGVRTLSAEDRTYNPMSYHNGTVWPHDNALAILGLKRYGFDEAANRIISGLVSAADHFEYARLPELFCGFDRSTGAPVPYPVACSPQAWAAAAPFAMVQAILGLEADAPAGVLRLRPRLPDWLDNLALRGVRIGSAVADITVSRADGARVDVREGALRVVTA